jgi:hypothetical protein
MRLALSTAGVLASLAVAPSAPAQPAPRRCDVHVLRAPEPVRLAVEARLAREPRCEAALAVRIIPTTDGLYLLAQTPGGHAYEMIVPDAEIAAELIATWAIHRDPAVAPEHAPSAVAPLAPPPIAPPPVEAHPALEAAPGATAEAAAGAPGPGAIAGQWLSLSGIAGAEVFGIRGDLDLWSKGGWSGGVAVAYTSMRMGNVSSVATLDFGDLRGTITAGHTFGTGALRIRGQIGVGVVQTELIGTVDGFGPISYAGTHPIGEGGAQLHVLLGTDRAWAISAGPTLTIYTQTFQLASDPFAGMQSVKRSLDVSFVGGLRRRL